MLNDKLGYTFDITKYSKDSQQHHFNKFHIFLNFDFNDGTLCFIEYPPEQRVHNQHFIHQGHAVHIYFSKFNHSISNGGLRHFINECNKCTWRKVYIHVPKRHPELKDEITKALVGLKQWEMIYEKNSVTTIYDYGSHIPGSPRKTYMYIGWVHDDNIATGYCDKKEDKS